MSWHRTLPDLLTICSDAPDARQVALSINLMARELTRRLLHIDLGYGARDPWTGTPWNWPFQVLGYTYGATADRLLEALEKGTPVPVYDDRALARKFAVSANHPYACGHAYRGPGPGYTLDDVIAEAAILRQLAIADMGQGTFNDVRKQWLQRLYGDRWS